MKKDGIQTRNRKLSAKVGADHQSVIFKHFLSLYLWLLKHYFHWNHLPSLRRSGRAWRTSLETVSMVAGGWAWVRIRIKSAMILKQIYHFFFNFQFQCQGMGMGYGSSLPMSGYYHQMGPMSQVKRWFSCLNVYAQLCSLNKFLLDLTKLFAPRKM